jgi:hypothetical protein
VNAAVVLARTVRAEWARLWTLRSTWVMALGVALVVLGPGALAGLDTSSGAGGGQGDAWEAVRFTALFALFGLVSLAVVATTGDYGSGGIVPTLQWTPRRGVLLVGRGAVVTATCTAIGVVLLSGAAVLVTLVAPELVLSADGAARMLPEMAFVLACGSALGVGLGLFLRSTAGGLVTALALLLILPLVLGNIPYEAVTAVAAHLPGSGAIRLVFGGGPGDDMTTASARLTLLAWGLGALALGGWRLLRTDAGR